MSNGKYIKPRLLAVDLGCEKDTLEFIATSDGQEYYYYESIYDDEEEQKKRWEEREKERMYKR